MINKFNPRKIKYIKIINFFLNLFFHEKRSEELPNIAEAKRILIIDPTGIGDIVMLIPLLRAIRRNNHNCIITLACCNWGKSILDGQGLVDNFVSIDSGFLNSTKKLFFCKNELNKQIKKINVVEYDYALEPRGDLRYIYFMHFCKAMRKVSYNYTGGECFLTDVVLPSNEITHLVEDKNYFIEQIGCKFTDDFERFPRLKLTAFQTEKKNLFVRENGLHNRVVIGIHPGASLEMRRWDGFSELLTRIQSNIDEVLFILFEGPKEKEQVDAIEETAKSVNAEYIRSNTSLEEYIIRIAACDAMICNDSGAGHIATALGVESFVVFGPAFPDQTKPYANSGVYCFSERTSCKPCLNMVCDKDKECLRKVSAEMVEKSVVFHINKIGARDGRR